MRILYESHFYLNTIVLPLLPKKLGNTGPTKGKRGDYHLESHECTWMFTPSFTPRVSGWGSEVYDKKTVARGINTETESERRPEG